MFGTFFWHNSSFHFNFFLWPVVEETKCFQSELQNSLEIISCLIALESAIDVETDITNCIKAKLVNGASQHKCWQTATELSLPFSKALYISKEKL